MEAMAARDVRADDADAVDDDASDAAEGDDAPRAAEEKPQRKRSRTRSRRRSRQSEDSAEAGGPEAADDGEAAAEAVGEPAEASSADADGARDERDPDASGADGTADAPDAAGDPDRTMAEGAGLEDRTLTEGDAGDKAAPDGDAAEDGASAEDGAGDDAGADGPSGMDVVDLGDDAPGEEPVEDPAPRARRSRSRGRRGGQGDESPRDGDVQVSGNDDAHDEARIPSKPRPKKYKIQEVVKVRQIMLVQVVKEERGNKGAALTTYLSLAGRYCVLMPNTARGGGISRKITNAPDRKKLKEIASEIDVPQGAGLIVRTAGAKRTKTEIKRDYEYLQRQWEQIRELTLGSIAPAPIYEEGNLIHRSIRDLYNRDIDEVIVEGEAGYRQAKDYMKLIMPSHAKNVKHYVDPLPLFARHQVENYLDSMFNPTVQLKSGGYIVIGITEALVAVDVNSGKATKEGSIEETALKTNLEAAEEVARQAKLRDLAGLIVIDFIDMDERRNNAAVEKRMKDALKNDRARIQIGRISSFGLMEMSRQRLRPGMLEATTQPCSHCHGTGLIRSDDSIALQVLRMLEEEGTRDRSREVLARLPVKVVNYLMNEKREHLTAIEARYGMVVRVEADPSLVGDAMPPLEKFKTASRQVPKPPANVVQMDTSWTPDGEDDAVEAEEADGDEAPEADEDRTEADAAGGEARRVEAEDAEGDDRPKKKRRRRSRRKKGNGDGAEGGSDARDEAPSREADMPVADPVDARAPDAEPDADGPADAPAGDAADAASDEAAEAPKRRSRSRSRSRRKPEATEGDGGDAGDGTAAVAAQDEAASGAEGDGTAEAAEAASEDAPKPRRSRARAKAAAPASEPSPAEADVAPAPAPDDVPEDAPDAAPADGPGADAADDAEGQAAPDEAPKPEDGLGQELVEAAEAAETAMQDAPDTRSDAPAKPARKGWWSR